VITVVEYTEAQKQIAKLLLEKPMTVEELRERLSFSASEINEALKGLIKLRLIERDSEGKYSLIKYVKDKFTEVEENFKAKFIIEAASPDEQSLKKQVELLESRIKLEKMKITFFEKGEIIKNGDVYSTFFDLEAYFSEFRDVVNFIVNYGPSSVELLEPSEFKLNASQAQDLLNLIVSAVHYYITLILDTRFKEYLENLKKQQKR